jgi:hypothetical protein
MSKCSMSAGRRHSKRAGRRTRKAKTTHRRTMRGGNFYGPSGAISPGAMEWGAVSNDAYSSATGANLGPDPGAPAGTSSVIGGRRRKTKGKKSAGRRRRSRKMKGGAFSPGNINSANTGYGYSSGGSSWASGSGYPVTTGYAANVGGAPMGADGVRSA